MVLIHFLVTFRMVTTKKANSNEGHARQWQEQENKLQTFMMTTAAHIFLVTLILLHYLIVNDFTTDLLYLKLSVAWYPTLLPPCMRTVPSLQFSITNCDTMCTTTTNRRQE